MTKRGTQDLGTRLLVDKGNGRRTTGRGGRRLGFLIFLKLLVCSLSFCKEMCQLATRSFHNVFMVNEGGERQLGPMNIFFGD